MGYQFGNLPSVVYLRTKKLRDQADQLLTLHDDLVELKATHDTQGGLDDETPGRTMFTHRTRVAWGIVCEHLEEVFGFTVPGFTIEV